MPSPKIHALTPDAAMKARELYAKVDSRGRRVWSYRSIARFLAVSETTIMRAVNGDGAYMATPEYKTDDDLKPEMNQALANLIKAGLAKTIEPQQDVLDRLAKDIKQVQEKDAKGDALLNELKGGKKDGTG